MTPNRTRNRIINFRCTDEEYDFITEKIEASQRTKTDFLLDTLQEKEIVIYKDLELMLAELKRQGINLNQALRYAHHDKNRLPELAETIRACNELYLKYLRIWQEANGKRRS